MTPEQAEVIAAASRDELRDALNSAYHPYPLRRQTRRDADLAILRAQEKQQYKGLKRLMAEHGKFSPLAVKAYEALIATRIEIIHMENPKP